MNRIDSHMHISNNTDDVLAMLDRLDLRTINICVAIDNQGKWRIQADAYRGIAQANPEHFAWITSFDLPRFDDPHYFDSVISQLEEDWQQGAVAVKIWKNIGMEVKRPDGEFMQMDDPFFQPLWDYLKDVKKPLIGHLGEPLACWKPLEENRPHCGYYKSEPQWHMYGKTEYPHHSTIIQARDNFLRQNPEILFIGAHLGSLEYDVDEVAKRLDEFPNFVVDNSARCWDMAIQDPMKVKAFCDRYQDRLLFGIDRHIAGGPLLAGNASQASVVESVEQEYERDFAYFETDELVDFHGTAYKGLGLSESVLQKFYWDNSKRYYQTPF